MKGNIKVVDAHDSEVSDTGSFAAILVMRDAKNKYLGKYMLSCLHVFGLLNQNLNNYRRETDIYTGKTRLAKYKGISGSFYNVNSKRWSFDAAIAKIDESQEALAWQTISSPRPISSLNYIEDLPKNAVIHTPRKKIYASELLAKRGNQLKVAYGPKLNKVSAVHRLVVQYKALTKFGDSGSPVLSEDEQTFLGMHISGKDGTGYMLPAIDLIDNASAFYEGLNNGSLTLDVE